MTERQERFSRAAERRRGKDRRTGVLDELYRRLVARGIVLDRRKGDRRHRGRDEAEFITQAHAYLYYADKIRQINRERAFEKLEPIPVPTFEDWIERLSGKPKKKRHGR